VTVAVADESVAFPTTQPTVAATRIETIAMTTINIRPRLLSESLITLTSQCEL
jgi:hypothetical protein